MGSISYVSTFLTALKKSGFWIVWIAKGVERPVKKSSDLNGFLQDAVSNDSKAVARAAFAYL